MQTGCERKGCERKATMTTLYASLHEDRSKNWTP